MTSNAAYTVTDPAIFGRLEFLIAIVAGALLVSSVWMLWITRDRRDHIRRERATDARLARRYRDDP